MTRQGQGQEPPVSPPHSVVGSITSVTGGFGHDRRWTGEIRALSSRDHFHLQRELSIVALKINATVNKREEVSA
jgi:hypothetical protein